MHGSWAVAVPWQTGGCGSPGRRRVGRCKILTSEQRVLMIQGLLVDHVDGSLPRKLEAGVSGDAHGCTARGARVLGVARARGPLHMGTAYGNCS